MMNLTSVGILFNKFSEKTHVFTEFICVFMPNLTGILLLQGIEHVV